MKKILSTTLFSVCLVGVSFAQKSETIESIRYFKTVEPNRTADGRYNLSGKRYDVEKLLVGDFNAPAEYFYAPSFDGAASLQIYRDSLDKTYLLETKRITNWDEVNDYINKTYPPNRKVRTLTLAQWEEIRERSRQRRAERDSDRLSRYHILTRTVPVSDTLADRIYKAVKQAVGYARKELKMNGQIADGYTAIFRCVVGDELWSLNYHIPEGEYKTLSDLFRQMIADVESGCFEEEKYIGAFTYLE